MTSSAKRVPMIATARQCYEGRWLHSGEPFEAVSEADAADLVAVRFALRVNRPETSPTNPSVATQEDPAGTYRTDDATLTGTDVQTKVLEPEEREPDKQTKGHYNRRDMRARK